MSAIRILEPASNRRGDLFGRLMADLFLALGYEVPSMNIHMPGREIDLRARHRLEPRMAIGECKATADPIGGDELNKFVGALDVEHPDDNTPITGYFISLGGFRETAIEQESKRRRTKIITLDARQIIDQLIQGNMIKPAETATDLAGRCCGAYHPHLELDGLPELLAHERGWIWAVHYAQGKARTHVALIHADGTPLALPLAQEIIASDTACGGTLAQLACLNTPPVTSPSTPATEEAAHAAYALYIAEECGHIQLDGLPADGEVGSRRLRLENLFVPLHVEITPKLVKMKPVSFVPENVGAPEDQTQAGSEDIADGDVNDAQFSMHEDFGAGPQPPHGFSMSGPKRRAFGSLLKKSSRIALLAPPGGGKSTLLKRLAIAYADPSRRPDDLPARDWLPLFFRCRDLRTLARASFVELLYALSQREPVRQHAAAFRALVDRALAEGRVMLLVDGLDEMPEAGDRAAFVCTLRTAMQAYPGTALVVTSREAGFRHVAAHLASVCRQVTLSAFDADDIRCLSVAWHAEVVGLSAEVRADAEKLAATIVTNDRIKRIAINPLLLTTLLLVRRWIGSLPTRRAVLYGEAVKVLLRTWNTEGHEPIPEEEAMPQLCYVASSMMIAKVERISRPRLAALLQEARDALPTELGYVKDSVADFIHRVEDRSSLLMMTGHDLEDSRLVEFYEFRHLTFQEFLAARAMVEGWYPGRQESDKLATVLEPYFADDKWLEVIPLAASLGRGATEALIVKLTQRVCAKVQESKDDKSRFTLWETRLIPGSLVTEVRVDELLGRCLADEAASSPMAIRAALQALVRHGLQPPWTPLSFLSRKSHGPALVRGRYGPELIAEAERVFLSEDEMEIGAKALGVIACWEITPPKVVDGTMPPPAVELSEGSFVVRLNVSADAVALADMLRSHTGLARCRAALGICQTWGRRVEALRNFDATALTTDLLPLLMSDEATDQYAALSALSTFRFQHTWQPPASPDLLDRLFALWRHGGPESVRGLAGRVLLNLPSGLSEDSLPWRRHIVR